MRTQYLPQALGWGELLRLGPLQTKPFNSAESQHELETKVCDLGLFNLAEVMKFLTEPGELLS